MSDPCPTIDESVLVVVKAVAARRAHHRADPAHSGLTAAAIAERVTGITLPPRGGHEGWWLVGRVLDEVADAEFSVWYIPGSRRIGLSQRDRPAPPAPPVSGPYYLDTLPGRMEIKLWSLRHAIRHQAPEKIWWWLAYRLPRQLVLFALVRIAAGTLHGNEHPDSIGYSDMYKRWEKGQGR